MEYFRKKVATSNSIHFDNIPENSVLWLRNLDEGKEERIFTLEDGAQFGGNVDLCFLISTKIQLFMI